MFLPRSEPVLYSLRNMLGSEFQPPTYYNVAYLRKDWEDCGQPPFI